jgi:hypothetical protein
LALLKEVRPDYYKQQWLKAQALGAQNSFNVRNVNGDVSNTSNESFTFG